MMLRSHLESSGNWLFRYRSFLPLFTVPLFLAGLSSFTYLGNSHALTEVWQIMCLAISVSGLAVRIITVGYAPGGTSGRNTKHQVAQMLNTDGMYSIVRHPLYLGNYLILAGIALLLHNWWLVLVLTCLFALYYERIMLAEEVFLQQQFGAAFEEWAAHTPAFFPVLTKWKKPELSFCWRTVLRREYTGIFLITTIFSVFDLAADSLVEHRLRFDWRWGLVAAAGLVIYLTLRTMKKHTRLLHMEGR